MTREDIKRALQGEDTRFGDYARSRSSVYSQGRSELDELKRRKEYEEAKRKRPSEDEQKRKAARDESKDAEDGQSKLPLENEAKKGNDYNFFADSYRTFIGGKNQSEIDKALGELKYNLPVFKYTSDKLSSGEVQNDPDLYKATRFAREMQSNAKAQALFQKNEELSAEQARLKSLYEKGDKSVSATFLNDEPWNPESKGKTIYSYTGEINQSEGPSFIDKADEAIGKLQGYANWEETKGLVGGLFKTVGSSLVAGMAAPAISVFGGTSLSGAFGNVLAGATLKTAADVAIDKPVDLISNLSDATRFSMGYVPAVAGGILGAGINKYKPSGDLRQGYIDIDESLVPEDTKYAYSKYKDLIKNWSKVGGDFEGTIPSIDNVMDGKESLNSYNKEKAGEFDSIVSKKTKEAQESIKTDLNDLRFAGAPSEYAAKKVEENDWYWGKMLNTSGMSMSELEGQVGLMALNSAITFATKNPSIGTKMLSSLALTGANAAFAVRSRDNEFFSQYSQAFNEKQDIILGENAISKMSYEELLSHVSEPKETMDKVVSQFGKFDKSQERHKRETLEMLIRTGIVKSDIPGINESAVAASDGSDELARQYRSMIYSDMGQNGLMLASLMPIKGGVPKAMQGLAKSTSDYYKNLSLSSFIRNNKAGRVLGKFTQLAAEVGWEAFVDEPIFEEIPQTMMDMKFKEGSLKENVGIFGSYLDKNKTISTGAKALFGMSGDERYDKNSELLDTYWSTVLSVAFMGVGRNVISSPIHAKELNRSFNADKLFDSVIEPGIKTSAFKAKASAYIGAVKRGEFDFVIKNLEELEKNPPEGYTAEDIKNEIKLAKRIASIADSKHVREYAKKSGGYGSEDHLLLTSLISDHENAAREGSLQARVANEAEANLLANFDESTFSKLVASINTKREDADKIGTGEAIGIAMLRNKLAALATITVNDPLGSKASKIKSQLITGSAGADLSRVSTALIEALANSKLITEEQKESLSKITGAKELSDAINEFVPVELNDDIKSIAYGLVSSYGAQYEEHMASILRGDQTLYDREKNTKVDRFHDVDELLDMHRESLNSNEKEQRILEAEEVKREAKKKEAKAKPAATVVAEPVVQPAVIDLDALEIPLPPESIAPEVKPVRNPEYVAPENKSQEAPELIPLDEDEAEQTPPDDELSSPPLTEADLGSSMSRAEELLVDEEFDPFSDYDKAEKAAKAAEERQEEQAPSQGITTDGISYPVLDLSQIDTDNFIYVTHQTDSVGLGQILSKGFDIRNGLNGTTLLGNKESIQSQIDSINSGHGHRGASRMLVFAFPKSKFGDVRQLDQISDMLIDEGVFSIPSQYVFGVFTENEKPPTQEVAPQKSKQDELKEKLNARLAHLADVATDVLGSKMNATGKQYSGKDFLPAMTGVLEVIMELGYTSFVDVVANASDAMKGNDRLAKIIDKISPKQWRAAYNSAAEFAEGTQSEEEVIAYSNDDVKAIVAGTYKKEEEVNINEDLEALNQPEKTEEEENKEIAKEVSEIVKGAASISIAMEKEDSSDFVNIDDEAPGTIDEDNVSVRFGRLPHTLFTSNPEIIKWLKTPKALEGATFEIEISTIPFDRVPQSRKDAGDYIPFDINNPNSWNEAAIFIKIKDKNGVVRPLNISFHNIAVNSMFEDSEGNIYPKFTEQDIDELVEFRNKIISLYAQTLAKDSNKELVVSGISIGRAKIKLNRKNGKPEQRSLSKIKGLIEGFNGDFSIINNNTLSLAYGRGWRGNFTVVGTDGVIGDTQEQNSGSMFAVKIDPVLGTKRKIKLNKRRFSQDKDTAEFIYKLLIDWNMSKGELALDRDGNVVLAGDGASNRLGISAEGLLSKIVNFGKRTQINKKDLPMLTHLLPKQFYIEGNSLYLGEAKFDISNPSGISPEIKAQIIDYIKNNFNWSINAHDLWNQTGANRKVADVFSGVTDYFRSNPEAKTVKFFDGMEIKREDLGLTWEAWIVKYDKLISDVADDIFESPYTFLNDVELADRMDKPTIKKVSKKKEQPQEAASEVISDTQKAEIVETPLDTQKSLETPENGLKSDASEQVSGKKKFKKRTSTDVDKISDLGVNAVGPARLSTRHTEEDNLTNVEQAWARKRISSLIEISDTEIEMANGDVAMGVANILKNIITLFSGAERGTAYHEAFHIVSLGLIPRNRRMMIYDSVRRTIPSLKDATNKDIEEYLAEEFRVWRETNKIGVKIPMLRSVFRKFSNLFTGMKSTNKADINRLFEDIEYGIFANKKGPKAKSEQSKFFTRFYVDGAARTLKSKGFNAINTLDMQYEVSKGLAFSFIELSGVEKVADIRNMSKDILYDSILSEYEYMEENGMEDSLKYKIYEDILEKFDDEIVPLVNKELSSFGIAPAVFDIDGNEIEDKDKDIVSKEVSKHTVESYKVPKSDNIPMEVKFFLWTIPQKEKNTEGTIVDKFNPLTGFKLFYDQTTSWVTVASDLGHLKSYTEMRNKIYSLGVVSGNLFYRSVLEKLDKSSDRFKTAFFAAVKCHRHDFASIAFTGDKNGNMAETDRRLRVIESKATTAKITKPKEWGENMMSIGFLFSDSVDGPVFNRANADSILARYKALVSFAGRLTNPLESAKITDEQITAAVNEYIDVFNKIGISINDSTIEEIIKHSYPNASRKNAIASLITQSKPEHPSFVITNIITDLVKNDGKLFVNRKEKVDRKDIYKSQKSTGFIAMMYFKANPNITETTSTGADGAKVYEISLPNYVTETADRISTDTEYRDKVMQSSFASGRIGQAAFEGDKTTVGGSIVLDQLQSGESKGLKTKTFLKFYEDNSGDKGRDYFALSPIEDYMMKMAATSSGYMLCPTMADKKTWYMFAGIKMPSFSVSKQEGTPIAVDMNSAVNGMTKQAITFPTKTVSIFNGYFEAEYLAMQDAWSAWKVAMGDKNKLEQTYHYGGVSQRGANEYTTKGKWNSGLGNGMKFRHFDEIAIDIKGDGSFINLNEYQEELIDQYGVINGMERFFVEMDSKIFNASNETKFQIMNATLANSITRELKWLVKNGAIAVQHKKNGVFYKNKKLDKSIFKDTRSYFIKQSNLNSKESLVSDYADTSAIYNMVAEHMVNTSISTIEFEKIFSKDPAFHKDPDAKIKRLTSILSTGTPCLSETGRTTFTSVELNDNEIPSPNLAEIKSRMMAAHINERHGDELNMTFNEILEAINSGNMDAINKLSDIKMIMDIVDAQTSGYNKVNETDASVFISPVMYRDILRKLGRWDEDLNEAFDLLESEDMSWMEDSAKYLKVMELALNPLKMIYYGDKFSNGLNIPKLDKMAMFCLFRSVATGANKALYERMNNPKDGQSKIDMVAFSSAVKSGNNNPIDYFDKDGNVASLDKFTEEIQNFEYLRHQLETEAHEEEEVGLATQVQKVAMSNIVSDKIYSNITIGGKKGATGQQLIEEWSNALIEISNRGRNDVENELGVKYESGELTFDKKKLYGFLHSEAVKSNMTDDVYETLMKAAEPNSRITLQAMADRDWIESKLVSFIMKKTLDVETPGGAFIQMSTFGINTLTDSITSEGYKLNGGRKLNYMNADGSMDCVVSLSLFKDVLPEDVKLMSPVKQRDWLLMHNIIGPDSDPAALGYRIPTQGMSSVSSLKVIDVIPKIIGDTIILPTEFTALTGSDFDVDKLYLARYNYAKNAAGRFEKVEFNDNKKSEKNPEKSKWQVNSNAAIQNRLLDVMMAAITEPSSIHETRLPLDATTSVIKDDILPDIDSVTGTGEKLGALMFTSPSYQTDKKVEYSTGKKNLGIMALANTNHVYTQMTNLTINPKQRTASKHGIFELGGIYGADGMRILDWLSAMINAHVDVAKDPYIIRLGVNEHTVNMVAFLLRAGIGGNAFYFLSQPSLKEAYAEVEEFNGKYEVNKDSVKKLHEVIKDKLQKYRNIASKVDGGKHAQYVETLFTEDKYGRRDMPTGDILQDRSKLKGNLNKDITNFDYLLHQMLVMETYLELLPYSNELSELVKYSQIETKKQGKSFIANNEFISKVNSLIMDDDNGTSVFSGVRNYYESTPLMARLRNSSGLIVAISRGLLFRTSRQVLSILNKINILAGREGFDNSQFMHGVSRYIETSIKDSFYRKYAEQNGIDINSLFFGEDTVAKELFHIKSAINNGHMPGYENNVFLKVLSYTMHSKSEESYPDHVSIDSSAKDDKNIQEKIKYYFSELLNPIYEDETKEGLSQEELDAVKSRNKDRNMLKDFANRFVLYQFYSTGDNSALNYVKLSEDDRISLEINSEQVDANNNPIKLALYDFIDDVLSELNNLSYEHTNGVALQNDVKFIEDLFVSRWWDNDLVPTVTPYKVRKGQYDEDGRPLIEDKPKRMSNKKYFGVEYELEFIDTTARAIGATSDGKGPVFRPFVKMIKTGTNGRQFEVLYKYIGNSTKTNAKGDTSTRPVYVAVNKKGSKASGFSLIESNSNTSIIKTNKLPQSNINSSLFAMESGFSKVSWFDMFGGLEDKFMESVGSSTVDKAVSTAIDNNSYSISYLDKAIEEAGITDAARIASMKEEFARGILSRFNELNLPDNTIVQEDRESALEELKTSAEAYLGQFIRKVEMAEPDMVESVEAKQGSMEIKEDESVRAGIIIENFTEYGNTYEFEIEDGKIISAKYKQGNGEFKDMNMASVEKTYARLKSKGETVVSEITPDTPTEADINLFGKDIDLSKIGIPYQLNDEQEAALKAIEAWVNDKTITTPFSLLGSAGSGKTSITRVLINALSNAEITYQLLAPTHRAKGVLSRATGKKAKTYHAYFQLVPEAREVGMKLEFGGANNYESNVDLYIIDEVSLISDKSVDEILKVAEATGAKVLFIGDHAQLYPVGNTDEKGMPKQSIGLESPTSIVLNKVMRVANGNPLADVLSIMRMYQAPGLMNVNGAEYNFTDQSKSVFSKRDAFNDQGGVVFLGEADRAKAIEQFVDMFFASEDYSKDVNFAKILAFRNDVIDSMNAYVRAKLGRKGIIEVGEQIIGYSQIKAGKTDLIANDDEYVVDSIGAPREITSSAVPGVTLKVVPVEIRMTNGASVGGVFNLLTDYSEETMLAIRAAILKRKQQISNMEPQERREANRNFFIALTKDFITLKPIKNSLIDNENASNNLKDRTIGFTYASTVHKAQGGEYQNVLVLDSDIRGIDKNFDGLIYRKALYTAVSRARRTATVITNTKKLNSDKKQVSADGTKIPESFKPNNSLIGNERPSDKC